MSDPLTLAIDDRAKKVAQLNDAFRTTFQGGRLVMTMGVDMLPAMVKAAALKAVADFNDFNGNNDPHGEHDFGAFDICNRTFFWKIDYYDKAMEFGSEDPTDSGQTTRVLTLMLSEEY